MAKEYKRVLIDFDSTLSDFDGHLFDTLNTKFGTSYTIADAINWDFIRNMDPEHVQHTWGKEVYESREWTLAIPPLPGAVLAMNMLWDAGFYCRVVTARKQYMGEWIKTWLDTNGLRWANVSCVESRSKGGWARQHRYTIAVDDAPH